MYWTPDKAYEEALRRIRVKEKTGGVELNLRGLEILNRLPLDLARLTSLQSLDLRGCELSDISPLAGLTSLQSLNLNYCNQLSDISPLAGLTSLRELILSECPQLSDLTPLARLTSLQELDLTCCWGFSGDLTPLAGLTSLISVSELFMTERSGPAQQDEARL